MPFAHLFPSSKTVCYTHVGAPDMIPLILDTLKVGIGVSDALLKTSNDLEEDNKTL